MEFYSMNITNFSQDKTIQIQTYKTLRDLNDDIASQRLPTIIFLGILIIFGLIGHISVILVYGFCYSPTTYRFYVLSLAVFDFLSCCIGMPFEMVDNLLPLMFYNEALCKIGRFLGNILRIGSAFLLIVIAIGRYWNVCHPLSKPVSIKTAKICVGIAIVFAILFSWPNAFIQGLRVKTFPGNITGYDCTMDDDMVKTEYPFVYNIVLFIIYIITFILLSIFYTKMVLEIRRHVRKTSSFRRSEKGQRMSPRITKILCVITLVFIICYLPHCIFDGGTAIKRAHLFPGSPLVLALLPLLSRTFFINNIINPLIYIIAEAKFRGILISKLRKIYLFLNCRMKLQQGRENDMMIR